MSKNKKNNKKNFYNSEIDFTDFNAVSSQDCTGLIPANPQSEESLKSYMQTYDYRAKIKKNN